MGRPVALVGARGGAEGGAAGAGRGGAAGRGAVGADGADAAGAMGGAAGTDGAGADGAGTDGAEAAGAVGATEGVGGAVGAAGVGATRAAGVAGTRGGMGAGAEGCSDAGRLVTRRAPARLTGAGAGGVDPGERAVGEAPDKISRSPAGVSSASPSSVAGVPLAAAAFLDAAAFLVGGAGSSGWTGRRRPSRSAFRRARSAWASSMDDEWLLTPMPRDRQRSSASLLVIPSSCASSYTRIFFGNGCYCPSIMSYMPARTYDPLSSHITSPVLPRAVGPSPLGWSTSGPRVARSPRRRPHHAGPGRRHAGLPPGPHRPAIPDTARRPDQVDPDPAPEPRHRSAPPGPARLWCGSAYTRCRSAGGLCRLPSAGLPSAGLRPSRTLPGSGRPRDLGSHPGQGPGRFDR